MQNVISIWRNRGTKKEIHEMIQLSDQDHKRLQEIVLTYKLPIAKAYDKLLLEKKIKMP